VTTLTIIPIPTFKDNYVWTIIDPTQHKAILVDPGDAAPVLQFLKQHHLVPVSILITHHHWDHTNGIKDIVASYPIPVYGPNNTLTEITHRVQEPDYIYIEHFTISPQIFNIPGHTLDHVAYYMPDRLFCGDTLFAAGCGRLFEGSAAQLFASLQKLASLPDGTRVYCAHEYTLNNLRFARTIEPNNPAITTRLQHAQRLRDKNQPTLPSTLREEKATNPFLRCHCPEVKIAVEQYAEMALSSSLEVFSWLRKWKDHF